MSASDRLGSGTKRKMKDRLHSWRLSADTATNARGSKVIDGRIYDARCVSIATYQAQNLCDTRGIDTCEANMRHV